MEAAEDIVSRSHSPIDDYRPMNNQRKPAVGDLIRIRIQPDKKHENMHTHGWITLITVECHEIEPKDKDGKEYVIKGIILKTGKPLFVGLKLMTGDDGIDYRLRQGWDIVQDSQQLDDDEKHNMRLTNPQHLDNVSILQTILTEQEFDDVTCTQQGYINMTLSNLYETPKTHPKLIKAHNNHEEQVETSTSTKPQLAGHTLSPTTPPNSNLSISESIERSDTSRSESEYESIMWDVTDYEYTRMLGRLLEDNLLTITSGHDKELMKDIDLLSQAITSEKKLIKQTNSMHDQLRSDSWIHSPSEIDRYITQRKKWYTVASRYKNKRDKVLHGIERATLTLGLPGCGENMTKLMKELEDSIDSNEFIRFLTLTDARMMKLDETIDQQDSGIYSDHLQSIGSIFNYEDFTLRMTDDMEYKGNISIAHEQGYPYKQVNEHAALKDLGKYEQRKGTDLTVLMAGRDVEQDVDAGPKMPIGLSDLLHYDAADLLEDAKNVHVNITKSIGEINNMSPNKHTEETLRDYERKTEKISEKKILISNKYTEYVMKYVETPGMDDVRKLCIEVTVILKNVRNAVEEFRVRAAPKVGYTENTYDELKDTKAPILNTNEFRGESSLPAYVKWIHENKALPSNLLNAKLTETLPPLVHDRLCQQYPEGGRNIDDVIRFLLKTYGRTAIIEEQLKRYHTSLGSLNSLVIGGYAMNPCNCKEIVTTSDEHLVGLNNIATLKQICTIYLGETTTKLWFQEYLYTHGFAGWLASNILTMTQINQFAAIPINTGEGKVKWIIEQIEVLKLKADKMVSSGVTESIHDVLETRATDY